MNDTSAVIALLGVVAAVILYSFGTLPATAQEACETYTIGTLTEPTL